MYAVFFACLATWFHGQGSPNCQVQREESPVVRPMYLPEADETENLGDGECLSHGAGLESTGHPNWGENPVAGYTKSQTVLVRF